MRLLRFIPYILILLLAACQPATATPPSIESDTPIPADDDVTALPTFTAAPSFTPAPTATSTFLPVPTRIAGTATWTPLSPFGSDDQAIPGDGLILTIVFDSNLRVGPGPEYDIVSAILSGTRVRAIARDIPGDWIQIRTSENLEGWIASGQFEGPLEVISIPVAGEVPTAGPTRTPTNTAAPGETQRVPTATATATPLPSGIPFSLSGSGAASCQSLTWRVPGGFPVDQPGDAFSMYDRLRASELDGPTRSYTILRGETPIFVNVSLQGDATASGCNEESLTCTTINFTLCAQATPNTAPGDARYQTPITLQLGLQSGGEFYPDVSIQLPTSFQIVE